MARKSYRSIIIVLIVFVVIAVIVRYFGGPLMDSLKSLHGGGGGH